MVVSSAMCAYCSEYHLNGLWPGVAVGGRESWKLLDLVSHLRRSYCSTLTVQMDHLTRSGFLSSVCCFATGLSGPLLLECRSHNTRLGQD